MTRPNKILITASKTTWRQRDHSRQIRETVSQASNILGNILQITSTNLLITSQLRKMHGASQTHVFCKAHHTRQNFLQRSFPRRNLTTGLRGSQWKDYNIPCKLNHRNCKKGNYKHLFIDYQKRNAMTTYALYSLLMIDECMDLLGETRIF